jgi:hypothetical protein
MLVYQRVTHIEPPEFSPETMSAEANSWHRGELLLGLVREELKLAKTRFALKEAPSAGIF